MVHFIKHIKHVEPYQLRLEFNTGEVVTVDLSDKIEEWGKRSGSKFHDLKDPGFFKSVQIDKEMGFVYWPNGIDLCPDMLYDLAKGEQVSSA